jgi:myo-inositol catabolism protein IolS
MRYETLGRSDVKVSVIGQGTGQFGTRAWGYKSTFDDQDIKQTVKEDIDSGINLFDTAETYGNGLSETLLGDALKGYDREDFVVITKVAPWNLGYEKIIKAADRSLSRLGLRYVDIYMVHYPNPLVPMKGTFRAMERLVKDGKIRFIGVSNFHPIQLKMAQDILAHEEIVANEIEYNILSRRSEYYTIPYCKSQKIAIITFSPLAGGMLTGRYSTSYRPEDRARAFNFAARNLRRADKLYTVLGDIAKNRHSSISQISLSWIASHQSCIPIPASLKAQEAQENAMAGSFTLTQGEIERINEASPSLPMMTYAFDHYVIRPISWMNATLKNYTS